MKIDEIELEVIKDYFKGLKRYRGIYYVTLRALVARRLRKEVCLDKNGNMSIMTYRQIAEIVLDDEFRTETVQYYCKNYYQSEALLNSLGSWKRWIISGEYPITKVVKEKEVKMVFGEPVITYVNTNKIVPMTLNEALAFCELTDNQRYHQLKEA